jgi:hypothetical protein
MDIPATIGMNPPTTYGINIPITTGMNPQQPLAAGVLQKPKKYSHNNRWHA